MIAEKLEYNKFKNRYQDRVHIGSGGFGTVYKVFDHAKNHYVALKTSSVKPEWNKFTLKNEVELVNKMQKHRNIARYDACYRYNTGIAGEMDFAILKFYEDGNLEQFLKKQELPIYDKKLIIQGILDGIQFLHRNEVIHRDLKAQNILMSREDGVWCPKITDFGLSREVGESTTITNSAVGISYAYAAPEQILNQKIYKNVDLWAVGVMIYRIMQGELPFKGREVGDGISAQSQFELSKKIVNLELPSELQGIAEPFRSMISACLVKDPKARVQTADVLLDMLHGRVVDAVIGEQAPSETDRYAIPPEEIDEPTVLITPNGATSSAPPAYESYTAPPPPETMTYTRPDPNLTQIQIPNPEPKEEKEEVFIPESGEEGGGLNFRHLLIVLSLLLCVGIAYWWMSSSPSASTAEGLSQYSGPLVPELPEIERYEDLDLDPSSRAGKVATALEEIETELKTDAADSNYRLHYLKAKLLGYRGDRPREVYISLKDARRVASSTAATGALKKDMLQDERADFRPFIETGKKAQNQWNELKRSL